MTFLLRTMRFLALPHLSKNLKVVNYKIYGTIPSRSNLDRLHHRLNNEYEIRGFLHWDVQLRDATVREALIVLWEAADRICTKRLKAGLAQLLDAMERHEHLRLDPVVRQRLLPVSAATIDRLLKPIRCDESRDCLRQRHQGRQDKHDHDEFGWRPANHHASVR